MSISFCLSDSIRNGKRLFTSGSVRAWISSWAEYRSQVFCVLPSLYWSCVLFSCYLAPHVASLNSLFFWSVKSWQAAHLFGIRSEFCFTFLWGAFSLIFFNRDIKPTNILINRFICVRTEVMAFSCKWRAFVMGKKVISGCRPAPVSCIAMQTQNFAFLIFSSLLAMALSKFPISAFLK